MDRGAWQAAIYGVAKESDTTQQLKTKCVRILCIQQKSYFRRTIK